MRNDEICQMCFRFMFMLIIPTVFKKYAMLISLEFY